MNKKERVDAALRGDAVDRVPASLWGHDYEREWSVQTFAEAMIENFTRNDWDFLNVHPRTSYAVEDWGVKVRPSGEKNKGTVYESSPIRTPSDWRRLRPLEPDRKALGEQLKALQLINHSVGYDAYFVETIYCPLGVARYLAGNNRDVVLQTLREDRSAMHAALRTITETFHSYAIDCMEQGASGIFYSTDKWASAGVLTADQYREFGEQYDLEFLDAIKRGSKFTILHNSGSQIYFDQLAAYPVQAINWDANDGSNPDLGEGKRRSGKAVMGGLSEQTTLKNGTVNRVQEEVAKAIELTGGRHFLLAPSGGVPPEIPTRNENAIRRALS